MILSRRRFLLESQNRTIDLAGGPTELISGYSSRFIVRDDHLLFASHNHRITAPGLWIALELSIAQSTQRSVIKEGLLPLESIDVVVKRRRERKTFS